MTALNTDIRIAALEAGVKMWEIAKYMGIYDTALSRLLRYELTVENREKILMAIKALSRRGNGSE